MGNKLCKKKVDCVDGSVGSGSAGNNPKSQQSTTLDRIINRLHVRFFT